MKVCGMSRILAIIPASVAQIIKLKPLTLTSEMMRHLECGREFEVNGHW